MGKRKKKQKKEKLQVIKSKSKPNIELGERPPMSEMEAPEGFRSIPMAQATMEYAKPLTELVENGEPDINDVLQISILLWNYALSVEKGKEDKKIEDTILNALRATFKLDLSDANAMLKKMVERRSYLFPPDIQPEYPLFMFIRKEIPTIIKPFDYSNLVISHDILPPDKEDKDLINKIDKLDGYINKGVEYDEYEELLHTIMDESEERFEKWLTDKGLKEGMDIFPSCLELYLRFIYGYMHDDIVILKSVPSMYLAEFFEDFMLRKMMVDNPNEYIYWVPALRLFYRFLYEKEYLENPDEIVEVIDTIEPHFIEVLRKQSA